MKLEDASLLLLVQGKKEPVSLYLHCLVILMLVTRMAMMAVTATAARLQPEHPQSLVRSVLGLGKDPTKPEARSPNLLPSSHTSPPILLSPAQGRPSMSWIPFFEYTLSYCRWKSVHPSKGSSSMFFCTPAPPVATMVLTARQ